MKFTLVFPPNRNIPSSPYGALPLLAGCLGRSGHQVSIVDANLEVFERLIEGPALERARGDFDRAWSHLRGKPSLLPHELSLLQGLATLSVVPFERVLQSGRAGRILRDPELFRDPEQVNWAYDTLANMLRAVYAINPVFYGLKPGFADDFFGYLERGFDNPISRIVESDVVDRILAGSPEVVGITIPFGEQLVEAFSLLKQLKERAPDLPTVVGGAIVSAYRQQLCQDPRFYRYADFGLPGEADDTIGQLADALQSGGDLSSVPNLYWRDRGGAIHAPTATSLPNLNDIAAPDFAAVPVGRYFLPYTIANYQTSRGCYYGKCTFCSFDIKQNFRFRRAELTIADIEKIQAQTGLKHFIFWDPLTPPRLMKSISLWNRERDGDRIFWGAETKFEKVFMDQAFTDLLYEGGARFLQFGFESGSQRMLDLMVKDNDLSRVDQMLGALQRSKIAVSVQWFIGFPGETRAEAEQSWRYLDERRDAVTLSSYMGTYTISPDDDVFQSKGDLYGIDIQQREDGMLDYRYRDGRGHYDREELHAAYLSRGDAETVTRMAFYLYLTDQPERVREISFFQRSGALPESWEDLEGSAPMLPAWNHVASYDFDVFTPPAEQGLPPEGGPLPRKVSHAAFVTPSQVIYPLLPVELEMLRRADGSRSPDEILSGLPGDPSELRARLLGFLRRGVLVVPHRERLAV